MIAIYNVWSMLAFDLTIVCGCGAILWVGGLDERIGVAIVVAASGATAVATLISHWFLITSRIPNGAINFATLVALDALMVRSRRFWPVWATGFQLATVALDLVMAIAPAQVRPYWLLRGKLAYPIMFVMLLGAFADRRRKLLDLDSVLLDDKGPPRSGQKSRQVSAQEQEAGTHHP